jgi:hypothetical protein
MKRRKRNREAGKRRKESVARLITLTKLLRHGDEFSWPVKVGDICQGNAPFE